MPDQRAKCERTELSKSKPARNSGDSCHAHTASFPHWLHLYSSLQNDHPYSSDKPHILQCKHLAFLLTSANCSMAAEFRQSLDKGTRENPDKIIGECRGTGHLKLSGKRIGKRCILNPIVCIETRPAGTALIVIKYPKGAARVGCPVEGGAALMARLKSWIGEDSDRDFDLLFELKHVIENTS
jgi:hypothetical protein